MLVEAEGDLFHGQFPQLRQLLRREEVVHGGGDALGRVDFAGLQPLAQVFGGKVHVDDLVGHGDDVVGDALLDADPGGALDDVVQALQVLDVQRRNHADARAQQFFHVLVAFGIAAAGGVGVGQFVDQGDGGPAGQHGVDVHLLQHDAAIFDPPPRHLFELADLGDGLRAAVRLDEADDHVDAVLPQPIAFLEHVVGLAHAGGEAEVDLQPAALLAADEVEEQSRAWAVVRRWTRLLCLDLTTPARAARDAD